MTFDHPLYPVNLDLAGRSCLVVGGGAVAARKVAGLLAYGARVHVVAPRVIADITTMAGVTVEERTYQRGEVRRYRLAIAATDDPAVNRAVFDDAERAGVWVNGANDPANCSFTLSAVVRRGPVTVAVSTGGRSPALASWLREKLEAEIGPEYEVLADLLATERATMKEAGMSTETVDWKRALDSDMLHLIQTGQIERARERLQACLSSS
jgi:siroheme synthase-like protein